jgi:hypothetical protein
VCTHRSEGFAEGRPFVNITKKDQRLITTDEARQFESRLYRTLEFAEVADMRLVRLESAHNMEELGGWPNGYEFPTEAVAAFALMADTLEDEAKRMLEWAHNMRNHSAHLWFVRGPAASEPDAS